MEFFSFSNVSTLVRQVLFSLVLVTLIPSFGSAAPPDLRQQLFQSDLQEFVSEQKKMRNDLPGMVAYISEIYSDRVIHSILEDEFQEPLFRDELANETMDTLLRRVGKYPILIGDPGVGKSSVLNLMTANIVRGKYPRAQAFREIFENAVVLRVSARRFIPGGSDLHAYLETVNFIETSLNRKIIIAIYESQFLDDKHISILREFADSQNPIPVILETDSKSYGNTIKGHPSFSSISKALLVSEMKTDEVIALINKQTVPQLHDQYGVLLTSDVVEAIVDVSKEFRRDVYEPRRSMYLAEEFAINWLRAHGAHGPAPTKVDMFHFVAKAARLPVIPQNEQEFAEYMQTLREKIKTRVVAQDVIVDGLVDQFKAALQSRTRQHSVAMILGPTGVGKSLTPEVLAEEFYGSSSRILKLDMTQFSDSSGLSSLFGAANGLVSSQEEKGAVCDFFDGPGMGGGVLILNEIEEANAEVFTRFMEMFDNGEFRGGDGRVRHIGKTLIVLTSNKNTKAILSYDAIKGMTRTELNRRLSQIKQDDLKKAFTEKSSYTESDGKVVKTAVLERIDRFYFAAPHLSDDALAVAGIEVAKFLKTQNKQSQTQLEVDPSFAEVMISTYYNEAAGARQIRTAVQQFLTKAPDEFKNQYGYGARRLIVSANVHPSMQTSSFITVRDPDSGHEITIDGPRVPVANKLHDPEFRERLNHLEERLNSEIFGQEDAIKAMVAAIKARYLKGGPEDVMAGFFIGTTGAGKSQIAKSTAKHLFGRADAYELFEMGKVQDPLDLYTIFSPPTGIIGSDGPGQLERFLISHPDGGVLLFDEMSNAGGGNTKVKEAIAKQFYTMMEQGIYRTPSGKVYDVSNHVILMTGNDGEEIFRGLSSDSMLEQAYIDATKNPKLINDLLIKAGFTSAFLGRMSFKAIMKPTLGRVKVLIARKMLNEWRNQVQKMQPVDIFYNDEFIEEIGMLMFSSESGARSINHFISASLGQAVAHQVLQLDWDMLLTTGKRAKVDVSVMVDQFKLPFYQDKPYKNKAVMTVKTSIDDQVMATDQVDFSRTATFMPQVHEDVALATAYHEMGHALGSFTEITGKKLVKITIIPEKIRDISALGYAQYKHVPTKVEQGHTFLVRAVAGAMMGSEAEILLGRERTTGRGNDMNNAGNLARRLVIEHQLLPELDFARAYIDEKGNIVNNLPIEERKILDDYLRGVINEARALSIKTLKENWHVVSAGAQLLMQYGHISGKDFERLKERGAEAVAQIPEARRAQMIDADGRMIVPIDVDGVVRPNEPRDDNEDESDDGCEKALLSKSI